MARIPVEQLVQFRKSSSYASVQMLSQLKAELSQLQEVNFDEALYNKVFDFVHHVLPSVQSRIDFSLKEESRLTALHDSSVKRETELGVLTGFYKTLLDTLTEKRLRLLSDLLSEVYSVVYANPAKRISLSSEEKRGKKVIKLNVVNRVVADDGQATDYVEDFTEGGGSLQIVFGVVIEVFFLMSTGLARIIFLDESLSSLATEVLSRFLQCLQKFNQEFGFTFVIVDHAIDRFLDTGLIDNFYMVSKGEYRRVSDVRLRKAEVSS